MVSFLSQLSGPRPSWKEKTKAMTAAAGIVQPYSKCIWSCSGYKGEIGITVMYASACSENESPDKSRKIAFPAKLK